MRPMSQGESPAASATTTDACCCCVVLGEIKGFMENNLNEVSNHLVEIFVKIDDIEKKAGKGGGGGASYRNQEVFAARRESDYTKSWTAKQGGTSRLQSALEADAMGNGGHRRGVQEEKAVIL